MNLIVEIITGILVAYIVYLFVKFSGLSTLNKNTKKNSIAGLVLFGYYLKYNLILPFSKEYIKDTFWVIFDSIVISAIVISFIEKEWISLAGILVFRFLVYVIFSEKLEERRKSDKFIKHLEKDKKRVDEMFKKFEKK